MEAAMKKHVLILMLCLALLLPALSACAAALPSQAAAPPSETPEATEEPAPVELPNPIHETDAGGLVQATGIPLPPPVGAEEVRYSYLELADESPLAQMAFRLNGDEAILRAQPFAGTEPSDISGLFYDWTVNTVSEVKHCRAEVHTDGEAGYIAWVDVAPGLLYNLGMSSGADAEKLTALANLAFYPVQADTDGDDGPDVYQELIDKVVQKLKEGMLVADTKELGISEIFARAVPNRLSLGWLRQDINGDRVEELLFGEIREEESGSPIYDIYTLLNGELDHTTSGWELNHWYLIEGGLLVNQYSGTGYDAYRTSYGLFNGKLVPANRAVDPSEYLTLPFTPFPEDSE
jgi:hypothetical protein